MDGWIMFGIVLFVLLGQAALWSWIIIQWRDKLPDVKVPTYREFYTAARSGIDAYRRNLRSRNRWIDTTHRNLRSRSRWRGGGWR